MPETESQNNATDAPSTASRSGLEGALRFVIVFLISTALLLTASRYAVGTAAMNAYLYQVANHTTIALRLVAYSSALEEAASRRANAAGIRSTLTAWAEGEHAPESLMMETDPGAPPLTPYESWLFRVGKLKQELNSEQEAIAQLELIALPGGGALEARQAELESNLASLDAASLREGPNGSIRVAYAEFVKEIESIRQTLTRGPGADRNSFTAGMTDLEVEVNRVRDRQLDFLTNRRTQLERRLQSDTGPMVSLTLKAGTRRQLEDARAKLAADEAATGKANDALRKKIEILQAERGEADPQTLAAMDKDLSFRFSVVPDCGALPSMAIFVSAMLAFPTRWWKRFAGIAAGLPLLYIINVLRLTCLGVIGAYDDGGEMFDFAHHYVWQGIYIVFVVAIWMVWVELLVKPGHRGQPSAAQ